MTEATKPMLRPAPHADDGESILSTAAKEFDDLAATVRIDAANTVVLGPPIPLEAIRELGPYRLLEQLGSGGMGIVYEAEDRVSGGRFAVKILRPTLIMDAEAKQRFFREAQAMAAIGHQRIVPIIRVGEDRGIPFIAMPLLLGETLEDRLQRGPAPTLDEIIRIGIEVAEGLDAAHRQGLIHRDVKPANVWLEEPFASVRLLDLGLAREITKETLLTQNGIVMGTPAYMSPEQARGEKLDARCDLFSLGCILYQLTTGVRAFDGPSPLNVLHQLETHNPPRVSAKNSRIPTMLSNLIMELLAKHAKDRPDSARDVMDRLRRIRLNDEPRTLPQAAFPIHGVFDDRAHSISSDTCEGVDDTNGISRNAFLATVFLLLVAFGSIWYFAFR